MAYIKNRPDTPFIVTSRKTTLVITSVRGGKSHGFIINGETKSVLDHPHTDKGVLVNGEVVPWTRAKRLPQVDYQSFKKLPTV